MQFLPNMIATALGGGSAVGHGSPHLPALRLSKRHPLGWDIFRALVGLCPRRWTSSATVATRPPPPKDGALRLAAELEGTYSDRATVEELVKLVHTVAADAPDLLDRLAQTRGAVAHPLNAEFLDSSLRPMGVAARDLRWTEWVRRRQAEIMSDIQNLEQDWVQKVERSGDQLRARWVTWLLTWTTRELRDQATSALLVWTLSPGNHR